MQTKLQLLFMKLETTDDSHIILKMEINGGVSTLPIY
jgi:hypothetical protein